MEALSLQDFAAIIQGRLCADPIPQECISNISIDSRKYTKNSVFFALKGNHSDGHQFVLPALNNGSVAAVIAESWLNRFTRPALDSLIAVDDPLTAMQRLTAWWRRSLAGKVLAITGSNGKTVVKDAVVHLLSEVYLCSGTPGSFNSTIGIPLSVIRIPKNVDYAVLEAGISNIGDADRFEQILQPNYGIFTNVGYAHLSSFGSRAKIAEEKVRLFRNIPAEGWLLVPAADKYIDEVIGNLSCKIYRIGQPMEALPYIESRRLEQGTMHLSMRFPKGEVIKFAISTPSQEIVSDIEIASCAGYLLGVNPETMEKALSGYNPGTTRMEIWKAPAGFTVVNDSCSSDPMSVRAALNSLASMKQDIGRRIFIFGGMKELGEFGTEEHIQVGELAASSNIDTLVLVGENSLSDTERAFRDRAPSGQVIRCKKPEEVKSYLLPILRWGDLVLVKGPRNMEIDRVAREIIESIAPSRFTVDLQAVNENVTRFQRAVGPKTKIMAMVKALAYGSDAIRLAIALQQIGVDYVGVASADEGGTLRRAGIDLPILVLISTPDEVEKIVRYHLTPIIYSYEIVRPLATAAREKGKIIDVHMEVDTGLGRLGVMPEATTELAKQISATGNLRLIGLMTHFAAAEDPSQDDFTHNQIRRFTDSINALREIGFSDLICHASATAGTIRFPEARFDMVRLGLGLYGLYPSAAVAKSIDLDLAVSLVSRVIETRTLHKGHTVGYGGTFTVPQDNFIVGVVPLGYYDGIPLILSNRGKVLVNGKVSKILGRISMDSMIIDLSDLPDVKPGTDVLIYGKHGGFIIRPEEVAATAETISYELLTRVAPRVQRIFSGKLK